MTACALASAFVASAEQPRYVPAVRRHAILHQRSAALDAGPALRRRPARRDERERDTDSRAKSHYCCRHDRTSVVAGRRPAMPLAAGPVPFPHGSGTGLEREGSVAFAAVVAAQLQPDVGIRIL